MASQSENIPLCIVACPDCGLPAEVLEQFSLDSTDGSVEHIALACVDGHYFRMPADRLPAQSQRQLQADRVHVNGVLSDRAAAACLAAGSGAQPSGPSLSRLPGCMGTVGSAAAAGGAAVTRLPAAAQVGNAAAGTPGSPVSPGTPVSTRGTA